MEEETLEFHSMLTYSFHVYQWPKELLKRIDHWIRNFIWSGDVDSRKHVIVTWKHVCKPFEERGLGLKSVTSINRAAMLKFGLVFHKRWIVLWTFPLLTTFCKFVFWKYFHKFRTLFSQQSPIPFIRFGLAETTSSLRITDCLLMR